MIDEDEEEVTVMTRVLYFSEPGTFSVLTLPESPEVIIRAVNGGRWAKLLPGAIGPLQATLQGDMVVVTRPDSAQSVLDLRISRREQEILSLLSEGLTTAEIAFRLMLSPRTIRGYVAGLKARFNAQTVQHLLAKAVSMGVIHPH